MNISIPEGYLKEGDEVSIVVKLHRVESANGSEKVVDIKFLKNGQPNLETVSIERIIPTIPWASLALAWLITFKGHFLKFLCALLMGIVNLLQPDEIVNGAQNDGKTTLSGEKLDELKSHHARNFPSLSSSISSTKSNTNQEWIFLESQPQPKPADLHVDLDAVFKDAEEKPKERENAEDVEVDSHAEPSTSSINLNSQEETSQSSISSTGNEESASVELPQQMLVVSGSSPSEPPVTSSEEFDEIQYDIVFLDGSEMCKKQDDVPAEENLIVSSNEKASSTDQQNEEAHDARDNSESPESTVSYEENGEWVMKFPTKEQQQPAKVPAIIVSPEKVLFVEPDSTTAGGEKQDEEASVLSPETIAWLKTYDDANIKASTVTSSSDVPVPQDSAQPDQQKNETNGSVSTLDNGSFDSYSFCEDNSFHSFNKRRESTKSCEDLDELEYQKKLIQIHEDSLTRFPPAAASEQSEESAVFPSFLLNLRRRQQKREAVVDKRTDENPKLLRCSNDEDAEFRCLAYTNDRMSMWEHWSVHNKTQYKGDWECAFCGALYSIREKFKRHLKNHHGNFTIEEHKKYEEWLKK